MVDPAPTLSRRALLAGLAACAAGSAGAQAGASGFQWRPWPSGRPQPPLELDTLGGPRWRLAQQRGKVVLANFWATWCEPCRAEMPSLARAAARLAERGLVVVTVNYKEGEPAVRRFVDGLGLQLPVLLDRDGAAAMAWTPRIFPTTVVVDRAGRASGVLVGEIDWDGDDALRHVQPLLRPH